MNQNNFFIKPGKYTDSDNIEIIKISKSFTRQGLGMVIEVLNWLHKNLKIRGSDPEFKNKFFRKRKASEIIKSGLASGCTDFAIVFIALMRARGVPTKYIETINTSWLEDPSPNFLEGHVFSETYVDGYWYIIDPQGAAIRPWYGKRFSVIAEGLDFSDINLNTIDDLKNSFYNFKKEANLN